VNIADLIPLVLLALFSAGLIIGGGIVFFVRRLMRSRQKVEIELSPLFLYLPQPTIFARPDCWLAIESSDTQAVQSALGLNHPTPCSWSDGLSGDKQLFISPPIRGWTVVIGSGLPDPGEDVDACFRLIVGLSRKLGKVQFFCANRVVNHHGWARAENGRVQRAYAWAGKTVWLQGERTAAECDLGFECRDYGDYGSEDCFSESNDVALNVEKVPLLAARWSLDPAAINAQFLEQECGVAGDLSHRY
jgi:hypothetical protein